MQGLEERALLTKLVALVDTGVNLNPSSSSYVNDSPYYDLADAYNAYDGSTNVSDNNGHGSALADATVAGIKAAMSQPGGAGASVKILPIRDTNPSGQLDINAIINGICYAADKGAAVINLSFAGPSDFVSSSQNTLHPNMSLSQAIRYAQTKGSVVVVAAGNNGDIIGGQQYGNQNIDIEEPFPVQPAAMGHDAGLTNEIVTASFNTITNTLPSDSNYGPVHVSVATPGSETSFAAGYLSGVAGVIAALRPDFGYAQIISRIQSTVQPVAALQGLVGTGGVVSPANAISGLLPANLTASATANPGTITGSSTVLNAQVSGLDGTTFSYQWTTLSAPNGATSPTFSANGSAAAATTTATFYAAGDYTFKVTASDGVGDTATATVTATVVPTLNSVTVAPSSTSLADGATTTFTATGNDQFNKALATQPTFTWSVSGTAGGTISSSGLYTAPATGSGADVVTARSGSFSQTANVAVTSPPPPPAGLNVQALGQDGTDLVANGGWSSNHPDGFQDIDLLLTGIPAGQNIAYVDVFGQGGGEWQYNPQNGPHPHGSDFAALVRTPGATTAHLYVSPYMNETGRSYEVVVYLTDGSRTELYTGPVNANNQLPMRSVQSLGQDGTDLVANGGWSSNHPDGYQDVDILLTGLSSSKTINYVDVFGQGGGEWQYNPLSGSHPHGSDFAALVRTAGSTSAHLYVQPYQDEVGRSYEVVIYYTDGTSVELYTNPVFAKARLADS